MKVQPDLEELTTNMEDNEGAETKEEEKLGKLQFSMDYDFQKSEVSSFYLSQNCWTVTLFSIRPYLSCSLQEHVKV